MVKFVLKIEWNFFLRSLNRGRIRVEVSDCRQHRKLVENRTAEIVDTFSSTMAYSCKEILT